MATVVKRETKAGPRYYVVYHFQGKRRWKLAGPRKDDANRMKTDIERDIYAGTHREAPEKTMQEAAGEWLEIRKPDIRPGTIAGYSSCVNRIVKHLGDKRLKDIGRREVDEFMATIKSGELSASTVNATLKVLKMVLSKAVEYGYISRNPAEHIRGVRSERVEIDFLEPPELVRLIDAAGKLDEAWGSKGHKRDYVTCRKPLLMFAALSGVRQSEALGLTWDCLDLEAGKAYIRKALQDGEFCPLKTEASRRTIDLPPVLVEELKTHQLRQAVELPANKMNLVFTTTLGTPLDKRNVNRRILEPSLTRAGLRTIGFHSLRHTYVSILIHQGENVKTIQSLVGHASARMTWDVYGHLFEGAGKAAAHRLEETLYGGGEDVGSGQEVTEEAGVA